MSHRALIAYERPDGRYDVHTSRWGGLDARLAGAITRFEPYADGLIDPVPRVVSRPFEEVLSMVDVARHEAVYRVSEAYVVEAYVALWFGLDHYVGDVAGTDTPEGLLVGVDGPADAREIRRWFEAAKDTVAEAVLGGYLDEDGARSALDAAVRRRAAGRSILDPAAPMSEY